MRWTGLIQRHRNDWNWLQVTVVGQQSGGASSFRKSVHSGRARRSPPLLLPPNRPVPQHLGEPEPRRLPSVQVRFHDVGREASEWQEPADVGDGHALMLSQIGDRPCLTTLDPASPPVGAYQSPNKRLVAPRFRLWRARAFWRDDHFPPTPALKAHRNADGQGLDLGGQAPGHQSAASMSAPSLGLSSLASSATRLRIPAACSVTEMPSGATSTRSISSLRMRACSAG
jgi:hypothetical protein